MLALDAGLRIGEIAALRWEDVDLENHLIYVNETVQRIPLQYNHSKTQVIVDDSKTNFSIRTIPMTSMLHKYLKEWNKQSTSKYVCSNKSTPSEPRLLTRYFHTIRKQSGIPSVHFHHLRHTFATRCIESNGDIVSISKLLGHKSTRTTLDVYTDSLLESRKYVIEKMEQKRQF